MVAPIAIGTGLAAAGALGGLFGQKSQPNLDIGPLLDTIRRSKSKQNQIATNLPGQLAPLGGQLKTGVTGAETAATDASRAAASNYLAETGKTTDAQGQELTDILRQRVLGNAPAEDQQLREELAATGGLERGGANAAFEKLAAERAGNIAQGQSQIELAAQAAKQDALTKIYAMDESMIQNKLGIDRDTLVALYDSGRQDLINEANSLLGIESNATGQELSAQEALLNDQLASGTAESAQRADIYNQLIGAGGTIAGYGLLKPRGTV